MKTDLEVVAEGLLFPEGPVALSDGTVLLVELARGTLSRVLKDGSVEVVAECGGGPNGAAIGPDGRVYVCNNGGFDDVTDPGGFFGTLGMPRDYVGGSIQAVNLEDGTVQTLYTNCGGHPLSGPNDIVFDDHGGFWFTDLGKTRERHHDHGGLYYATIDGSSISEVAYPLTTPNGVGLSPDGATLYSAETNTGRLFSWTVVGPGQLEFPRPPSAQGELLYATDGIRRFDSMAVDSAGNICVGTLGKGGGITVVSPDGAAREVPTGDPLTTNICFGGPELATAYVTCSVTGTLRSMPWPQAGLPLAFSR